MGEKEDLIRLEWLNSCGFLIDPFNPDSYRAETDKLFKLPGLPSYVDRVDTPLLIGNFESPGYHFIFSQPGGGKSSLRKRIHLEFEQSLTPINALVVDYLDHGYSSTGASLSDHVKRIIRLVESATITNMREVKKLVSSSPHKAVHEMVKVCQRLGFQGVYVLIDNLDLQAYRKITPLVGDRKLYEIKGFVLKLFVPNEFLSLAQTTFPFNKYPPNILSWDRDDLMKVLNQRLVVCFGPEYQITPDVLPIMSLFGGFQNLAERVENTFIQLGMMSDGFDLMWRMGHYLIEEHLQRSTNLLKGDLITEAAFARARLRLFEDILSLNRFSRTGFEGHLDFELKHFASPPNGNKPKAKIYLCFAERDERSVYEGLYQELRLNNYQPWMRSRDVLPGENRDLAIKAAIEKSDFFLICLSRISLRARGDFQKELKLASSIQNGLKDNDIYIIPVRMENCTPPDDLKQWYADWFEKNKRERLFAAFEEGKIRRRQKR